MGREDISLFTQSYVIGSKKKDGIGDNFVKKVEIMLLGGRNLRPCLHGVGDPGLVG